MTRWRRRRLTGSIAAALLVAAVVAGLVLWLYPSDTYVLLPDKAHPAAEVVSVKGAKPDADGGGIYFLDVIERKATLLEDMFHGVAGSGASFLPASEVQQPGVSESQTQQFELQEMATSQQIAAAVALKQLRRRHPGDLVRLGVRNGSGLRTVTLRTIADPSDPKVPIVGILIEQAAHIKLPFPVSIDTGNIGGPSAGLAFALEVMEKLGHDVDRGYRVAATGEIFLDGAVGPIGGVRQKIYGARKSGVDIMLVPAGDNAQVAKRYAGPVRVIPVQSFRQALHALATLPPKR